MEEITFIFCEMLITATAVMMATLDNNTANDLSVTPFNTTKF